MKQAGFLQDGTAFWAEGTPGEPPVVFIHGLGLCSGIWDPFVSSLADNYSLIRYDLYGHGKSKAFAGNMTLSTLSSQLLAVIDHLEIKKACLVGFSLGGMINRRFALDFPGRVAGLAILNSPHERDSHMQDEVEERALEAQSGGPSATLQAALERWLTGEFIENNPECVKQICQWVLACDPDSYSQARQVLAFGVKELIRPQPSIQLPALVMTCENDTGSTPAMSRGIAAEISGAQLEIINGLKHLGLVEEPACFLEPLSRFLGGLYQQ